MPPAPPCNDVPPTSLGEKSVATQPMFRDGRLDFEAWENREEKWKEYMGPMEQCRLNLERWKASGEPKRWVEAHNYKWNYGDWLQLLDSLEKSQYWPMDPDAVGAVLEELKRHSGVAENRARLLPEDLACKFANALQDAAGEARQICANLLAEAQQRAREANARYQYAMKKNLSQLSSAQKAEWEAEYRERVIEGPLPRFTDAYALALEGLVWLSAGMTNRGRGTYEEGFMGISRVQLPWEYNHSVPNARDEYFAWSREWIKRFDRAAFWYKEGRGNDAGELVSVVLQADSWDPAAKAACAPLRRVFARAQYDVIEGLRANWPSLTS